MKVNRCFFTEEKCACWHRWLWCIHRRYSLDFFSPIGKYSRPVMGEEKPMLLTFPMVHVSYVNSAHPSPQYIKGSLRHNDIIYINAHKHIAYMWTESGETGFIIMLSTNRYTMAQSNILPGPQCNIHPSVYQDTPWMAVLSHFIFVDGLTSFYVCFEQTYFQRAQLNTNYLSIKVLPMSSQMMCH